MMGVEILPQDQEEEEEDLGQHSLSMGEAADLAALKQQATRAVALQQRCGPDASSEPLKKSIILGDGIPCKASCQEDDKALFDKTEGHVFVTTAQLLFVELNGSEHDLAIGACTIQLHALQDEPEQCLYLQLGGSSQQQGDDGDDDGVLEVSFVPSTEEDAQRLFHALCKLVSRYPIEVDDDENDHPGGMMGAGGGGMLMMGDDDDGNDGLIWAPSSEQTEDTDGGASEQERQAMLDRLDNLLVVDPKYEIDSGDDDNGQFDDAEEQ